MVDVAVLDTRALEAIRSDPVDRRGSATVACFFGRPLAVLGLALALVPPFSAAAPAHADHEPGHDPDPGCGMGTGDAPLAPGAVYLHGGAVISFARLGDFVLRIEGHLDGVVPTRNIDV